MLFSRRSFWLSLLLLGVIVMPTLAAKGGGKGKPGGEDPPPVELPPIRYQIKYPTFPVNPANPQPYINDVNNLGQVVGRFWTGTHGHAFLYDPTTDPNNAIDLNAITVIGIPDGFYIRSALAINEHQVIVGNLRDDFGNQIGYALDYAAETPVIDLLPDLGSTYSIGREINENGDIQGYYTDTEGIQQPYFYHSDFYNGGDRAELDGVPLDFRDDIAIPLPFSDYTLALNNPYNGRPAQLLGSSDGVPFRYTTGESPTFETFTELDGITVVDINDYGTFSGSGWLTDPNGKGKKEVWRGFRYNTSLDVLPVGSGAGALNLSGDLIGGGMVYRDDWGWMDLDLLVDGSEAELSIWLADSFDGRSPHLMAISDRITAEDAGFITGRVYSTHEDGSLNLIFFFLTPVPEL